MLSKSSFKAMNELRYEFIASEDDDILIIVYTALLFLALFAHLLMSL
jgi:hypothetical protein